MILCLQLMLDKDMLGELSQALWEEILDTLDAVTPFIEDTRPGLAFLDLGRISDDDAARTCIARVGSLVTPFALPFITGVANTMFCSHVAAIVAYQRRNDAYTVCTLGNEARFLSALPITILAPTLTIETDVLERLHLLGITTLGQLANLPHGPFVRRFGKTAARWHECASGIDRRLLAPRGHRLSIEASLLGEGYANEEAQVFFALRLLLSRIGEDLGRFGKRAGMLCLGLELEDGDLVMVDVPLALPTADERGMFDVLRAKLEGRTFASAIVGLRLQALRLEEAGERTSFFPTDDIDPQNLAVTLARLEAILGQPVQRALLHDSHVLENRFSYVPFKLA